MFDVYFASFCCGIIRPIAELCKIALEFWNFDTGILEFWNFSLVFSRTFSRALSGQ